MENNIEKPSAVPCFCIFSHNCWNTLWHYRNTGWQDKSRCNTISQQGSQSQAVTNITEAWVTPAWYRTHTSPCNLTWFHSPLTDPFPQSHDDAISSVTFFSRMEVPPAATTLTASREAGSSLQHSRALHQAAWWGRSRAVKTALIPTSRTLWPIARDGSATLHSILTLTFWNIQVSLPIST